MSASPKQKGLVRQLIADAENDEELLERVVAIVRKCAPEKLLDAPPEEARKCPLSPKKQLAIALLTSGLEMQEVASRVGVTPKTLYRWRQDPQFAAELESQLRQLVDSARNGLIALLNRAVHVLGDILNNGESAVARVAAAKAVLDRCALHPQVARMVSQEVDRFVETMQARLDKETFEQVVKAANC